MLRTFSVHYTKLDEEDPWLGILGAVMFAMRATIHSMSRATPAQLVFKRDTMLNVQHKANWTSDIPREEQPYDRICRWQILQIPEEGTRHLSQSELVLLI